MLQSGLKLAGIPLIIESRCKYCISLLPPKKEKTVYSQSSFLVSSAMAKYVNNCKRSTSYCFKVILLGDYNVGKTSIFYRFRDNAFKERSQVTIGTDNHSKTVVVDNRSVTLVLWDTVGTEKFRTLTRNYFRNAHACLLVYSVDEPDTLASLTNWVQDADDFADTALKVLVGNKNDRKCNTDQDKVSAFAQHHDCDIVFSVSAKTGDGIDEMFQIIARKLISEESRAQQSQQLFDDLRILEPTTEVKSSCC